MTNGRLNGIGKPYVRGDGRWVVPFRLPDGKKIKIAVRRGENVTTEKGAIEWAFAEILKKRMNGALEQTRPVLPKRLGPTLREKADEWLGLRKGDADVAGATYDNNEAQMRLHVFPIFGDVPVAVMNEPETKARLAGWVRDLRAKRGEDGRRTVRNIFSTFRLFLDWCESPESRCDLSENPLRTEWAKRLLPKRRKSEARFATLDGPPLSPQDIQKILDNTEVELRWRARIALVFTDPMRDGEIAGLKIQDVYRDAEIPFVDVKKACVLNHKDGFAKIGKVKKEWSNRNGFPCTRLPRLPSKHGSRRVGRSSSADSLGRATRSSRETMVNSAALTVLMPFEKPLRLRVCPRPWPTRRSYFTTLGAAWPPGSRMQVWPTH